MGIFYMYIISTITATVDNPKNHIELIDLAKYLPLDNYLDDVAVIGIKYAYAGGNSVIFRGVAKLKNHFSNSLTLTLNCHNRHFVCVRIYKNSTWHITGCTSNEELVSVVEKLQRKIQNVKGCKLITLEHTFPFLCSKDHIVYSSDGIIIGWYKLNKGEIHGRKVGNVTVNGPMGTICHEFDYSSPSLQQSPRISIHMINIFFDLKTPVAQYDFHTFLLASGYSSRFDIDIDASVRIKMICGATVVVYASGKVNVSGLSLMEQCEDTCKEIISIFNTFIGSRKKLLYVS